MTTTVLAFIPSPSQGVWHLFGVLPVRAYALCIIAGIVAALVIGDRRWVARGGERGVIYDVALWAVPFGLIGGRLYHVMTDWPKYFGADGAGFLAALRIWDGGLGIWGAVALGGVGAWIACRRRDIPLPAFGDAIAPGIILAQAIGRLGNYFNQELYGRETDLPWGLTIWERLDPSGVVSPHSLDGVSTGQVYAVVHPTFLYELIWNLLIFALLIWVDRRFKIGHGRLFALYVAGYCVGRFGVELMRSDTATLIAGIRINTFTSMFVFIGAVIYIMVAPKGREDPATLGGSEADGNRDSAFDDLGEELTAVAATSGVVAAAKVAGDEDTADTSDTPSDDAREASLGSVEGAEAVEAQDVAPTVHQTAVAAAADADSLAEDTAENVPTDEVAESVEVPAVALEGTEVAEALNADVEPEPEEATAESADAEPEDGLGSVDADEVAEAQDDAAEVHDATLEGAASAETIAADIAAKDTADAEPAAAAAATDNSTPDESTTDESTAEPEDGLGSVDADEVAEAQADVTEVHQAAVTGAEDAEALADDVAADNTSADAEPTDAAAVTDESTTDESTAEPEDGLGSVDGDEVAEAQDDGDEVAEAQDDVTEVHQAAVAGADDAEALADDVAVDNTSADPEPTDAAAVTDESTTDNSTTDESTANDSTAEPEDGLGSVDADEVAETQDDVTEVHQAAFAGADDAEALAADVAADNTSADPEPTDATAATDNSTTDESTTDKSTAQPEDGLGSVDADEVAEAQDDVTEVHEAAVAGADDAEALAADVAADNTADADADADAESASADVAAEPAKSTISEPPRRRWWRRG